MNDISKAGSWEGLDQAITPAEAVRRLQARGIHLSERTLREFARRVGACRIIGKAMFLMPADVDAILEASRPQPVPAPNGAALGAQRDYEKLLALRERLQKEKASKVKTRKQR